MLVGSALSVKPYYIENGKSLNPDLMDMKTWMANHRRLFPALYTLITFAIFGSPVMTGIELATNPSVQYWIGLGAWSVILVPILLVGAHIAHIMARRPSFLAMLASTLAPSLIVMVIGCYYQQGASHIANKLLSGDCITLQSKAYLEEAYQQAEAVFGTCTANVALATNQTQEVVQQAMVMQDCPAFYDSPYTKQWKYIATLEQSQACSGWCQQGVVPLFTPSPTAKDPCTLVAGMMLETTVATSAGRMFIVGMVDLLLSIFIIGFLQEFMVKAEIEW